MDNLKTNTPRLETERLVLRRFEPGDVDAVLAIYGDPVVMQYVPVVPLQSREEAEVFLREHYLASYEAEVGCDYAICLKEDNVPIGYVCCELSGTRDFGYGLRKEFWRQGIVSEAAQAVVDWLRSQGLSYITATHDVNNPGSGGVMRRIGMKYCYSYRELWQPKNFWVTFRMYQLNLDGQEERVDMTLWNQMEDHFIEELDEK